jgi:tau tubulin kinase
MALKKANAFFSILPAGLVGSSPVTEQRDPLKERVKEHRMRRFHSSGDTSRRPISCKLNNRDTSITQFAVIDDDNVSALQQVTRGGGGESLSCSEFLNTIRKSRRAGVAQSV